MLRSFLGTASGRNIPVLTSPKDLGSGSTTPESGPNMRILLFSAVAFKMPTKNNNLIRSQKTVDNKLFCSLMDGFRSGSGSGYIQIIMDTDPGGKKKIYS